MLPLGLLLLAFISRQLGRILTLAFSWATLVLFGRVPQDRQPYLSAMAAAALIWPVIVAGIAYPSFATFVIGFFTVPDWLDAWVRLAMLALAITLPLVVGALSSRLPEEGKRPRGRELLVSVLRGYPNALALFVVILWMMLVAPLGKVRALLRRWDAVHVPLAVKPGGYESVVQDLSRVLQRAGLRVTRRRAPWAYELPGKILGVLGGGSVRALVPTHLWQLVGDGFEMTLHPMDLSLVGRSMTLARARAAIVRELTFTEAYQTWSKDAQELEERIGKAARGEDDLDAIGLELTKRDIAYEEWEILYRLVLQVRLRLSALDADPVDREEQTAEPLHERVT